MTAAAIAVVILGTLPMGFYFFLRQNKTFKHAPRIFGWLLISCACVLIDRLLQYTRLSFWNKELLFLPLNVSFLIGPLAFFFVKSRLYPQFEWQRADIKHFLFPLTQIIVLTLLATTDIRTKETLQLYFFSPVTGNFERGVFAIQCTLYLYFAYRFVKHARTRAEKSMAALNIAHITSALRYQFLVVGWLKRCYKVLITLFGIHASFIVFDYFVYKLFDANLQTRTLFSSMYILSLGAVVAWLTLNGFFIMRRKL